MNNRGKYPFNEYRVYGPRIHQGRRVVYLYKLGKNYDIHITLAYAKYLMSIEVGRWLGSDEKVDHINGDKLDDRIENYQILTLVEHQKKHRKGSTMIQYICENCGKDFEYRKDGKNHRYCSRKCLYEGQRL